MKANGAKRKIFNDAVDLLNGAEDTSAYVCVIETNVIHRRFAELLPSEKAAALVERTIWHPFTIW